MNRAFFVLMLSLFSCLLNSASAKSQGALITTSMNNSYPVVGQKVTLNYLIAVNGFFIGATTFQLPSLSKARLSLSSSFAINGSSVIKGKNYATQLWQLDLYPEHAGLLELPAITFKTRYTDINGNNQSQTVSSDRLILFSYIPEELKNNQQYIVSSDVQVTDNWSTSQDSYQVGDIIQRKVSITVADIKSIQIPSLVFNKRDGLKLNIPEAKLEDEYNRGDQVAHLQQNISYVLQQSGRFELGGESIRWWHPEDGLQEAKFATVRLHVEGVSLFQKQLFTVILIFILMMAVLYFNLKKRPKSLTSQLKKALKQQQWRLLIRLLYKRSDQQSALGLLKKGEHSQTAASLLACQYKSTASDEKTINIGESQLKKLIK